VLNRSRTARRLAVVFALAAIAVMQASPVSAGARELPPDLRLAKLAEFRVQRSGGDRLLRFTTRILNRGAGPLEIRGQRACSGQACPTMNAVQRIYRSDGSFVRHAQGKLRYAGDGHNHWHVQRMQLYELLPLGPGGRPWPGARPLRGAKVGFCFFDIYRWFPGDAGSPGARQYQESGCGTRGSVNARVGLSVGWMDEYPWHFAYQWIDISGLPAGSFRVCVTADPLGRYIETSEANNQSWANVRIDARKVVVTRRGTSRCVPGQSQASLVARAARLPDATPRFVSMSAALTYCRIEPEGTATSSA
jgi:hypothetical protein